MNVSGPCLVIMKNGVVFNKYEVAATETTPLMITTNLYYFDKKDDAEIYVKFLQQEEGEKELRKLLKSDRTFMWEKEEYKAFMKTIDWDVLKNRVKTLNFTTETVRVLRKAKR